MRSHRPSPRLTDSGALGPESVSQGGDSREQMSVSDAASGRSHAVLVAPEDIPALVEKIKTAEAVGLDLETTGLDPRRDRIRLMSLSTSQGVWLVDRFQSVPTPILEA